MTAIYLGVSATRAPWSAALRSYVRDHTQGIALEVVMDRAGLARLAPRLDVLVVDDIMRLFSRADLAAAQSRGAHVIGLFDGAAGMGQRYLADLGADQLLPASTPPPELAAAILRVGPRSVVPAGAKEAPPSSCRAHTPVKRGWLSVWAKASGGAGLSELVVAAAEMLASRQRALLIEADDLAPVLASRLLRSAETGLNWALSRASQGLPALPEALSTGRGDGSRPLGRFDAVCALPGPAQAVNPALVARLAEEAVVPYDHVMVEAGWLVDRSVPGPRLPAAPVVRRADYVVVVGAADPEGAARLVEWRAAAVAAGVTAPCWAVFGRSPASRYERDHLRSLVEANTGRSPFAGVAFLPDDPVVARARWNAELVWKGPWRKAVRALVEAVHQAAAGAVAAGPAPAALPRQEALATRPRRMAGVLS